MAPGTLYATHVNLASTMRQSIMKTASSVHSATNEVGVNSSRIAHLLKILSASAGQAPSLDKTAATSLELTVFPALLATFLQATTRPASPGPIVPYLGSRPGTQPVPAWTQSVRTEASQPHHSGRPRALHQGQPLSSPPQSGPGLLSCPLHPPWWLLGALHLLVSWA